MSVRVIDFGSHRRSESSERAVYTVAEVAEMLNLALGGTYALVRAGEIPARKLGGRWVIPKAAFHDWLNAVTVESSAGWS